MNKILIEACSVAHVFCLFFCICQILYGEHVLFLSTGKVNVHVLSDIQGNRVTSYRILFFPILVSPEARIMSGVL